MSRWMALLIVLSLFISACRQAADSTSPITATDDPPVVSTFSIVAIDRATGEMGIAVQSRFIAVGSVVPWAKATVGAVATQSFANTTFGPEGLKLMSEGQTARQALDKLLAADKDRDRRQVGFVDAKGNVASFTGAKCMPWAGHIEGKDFCAQGNILASEEVVKSMGRVFEETQGELGHRLLAALQAGQDAGGDKRGMQSAALLIVRDKGGYSGFNDRYRDLRVDDHPAPIAELRRIYEIHKKIFPPPKPPKPPAPAPTAQPSLHARQNPAPAHEWKVGTPIVTYYAGPPMSEAVARQMADGGFNTVWGGESDLDLLQRHGLRGMLHHPLLNPATLDSPEKTKQLDDLIARVSKHPAFYSYYIIDEPSAASFPALGRLVAHLRHRDPAHMAYINLFPTYASNEQLGNKGDTVTAYREHLKQFVDLVKPQLISYDNYQFYENPKNNPRQYFLNLAMVRKASQDAGIPFLNIVQACSWSPGVVRVPTPNEMRYLVNTTIAYGALGISYYVYSAPGHLGGMRKEDGSPTPIYEAVKPLNPQFVALVSELQPLRSLAIYHTRLKEPGCLPLPEQAPFRPLADQPADFPAGLLLGYFGKQDAPTHVMVVNLDCDKETTTTLRGPSNLESFDPDTRKWTPASAPTLELKLPPGGARLLRLAPNQP